MHRPSQILGLRLRPISITVLVTTTLLFVAADPHGRSVPTANHHNVRQHRAASRLIEPRGANSNERHPTTIPS